MKIYLAGKIGPNDWRHSIVSRLKEYNGAESAESSGGGEGLVLPAEWLTIPNSIFGEHDYTGPYFTSNRDRRGSFHGRNSHGNGPLDEWPCPVWSPVEFEDAPPKHGGDYPDEEKTRAHLFRLCLHAVMRSDAVFVWMDSPTAYGTLFELGFALAHRKPIWWAEPIGGYDDLGDLWFARQAAISAFTYTRWPNAKDALRHFLDRFAPKITGYVYVLQSGTHYKIGKSKDVDQRVTQISPKTPLPVTLIHTIGSDDMSWAEWVLHRKFAEYRTNGEWFALPPDAVAWLKEQKTMRRKQG